MMLQYLHRLLEAEDDEEGRAVAENLALVSVVVVVVVVAAVAVIFVVVAVFAVAESTAAVA